MNERNPLKTEEELLVAIEALFKEISPPDTSEAIDVALREEGYDPDEVGRRFQAIAQKAMEISPLNWRNRASLEIEQATARLDAAKIQAMPTNRKDLITEIREILNSLGPSPLFSVHYRNLESITVEDLESLLTELRYLNNDSDSTEV
jgi:hypothetical protein